MVEGPGATRNGRKVQTAVGKAVAVVPDAPANSALAPVLPRHLAGELTGSVLDEAFTVGKELFLIFAGARTAPTALRLHFGMTGSLATRKVKANDIGIKTSGVAPWKQHLDPSLRLYFVDENEKQSQFDRASHHIVLEAWGTTVTYPTSVANARNKLMEMSSRDSCSVLFNAQVVFTVIRETGNNLIISDALLDQDIFPGVGNIIKIEALHKSGIDPRRIVSSLTDAELRRVVRHARKFSMNWLTSGRAGPKLVYNLTTCGTCRGTTVKMQKIGGAGGGSDDAGKGHNFMARVTFWCTVCQPFDAGGSKQTVLNLAANEGRGIYGDESDAARAAQRPRARCPQHGLNTVKLCRSRKNNVNALRIFHTCKRRGCPFFEWADAAFGKCRCGRKSILRVSKTAKSGGKWFLSCAAGDKGARGNDSHGCGHFEWATDAHLEPIRSLLTPLL